MYAYVIVFFILCNGISFSHNQIPTTNELETEINAISMRATHLTSTNITTDTQTIIDTQSVDSTQKESDSSQQADLEDEQAANYEEHTDSNSQDNSPSPAIAPGETTLLPAETTEIFINSNTRHDDQLQEDNQKYPTLAWAVAISYMLGGDGAPYSEYKKALAEYNFIPNKTLSNGEAKVAYRIDDNILFIFFRGSKTKTDWYSTDVTLASGNLKKHPRYTRSYGVVTAAKAVYPQACTTVIFGHSLGGALASALGKEKLCKKDRIITYNKGAGLSNLNPWEQSNPNETAYRTQGDFVSALCSYDRNNKHLKNSSSITNIFTTHNDIEKTAQTKLSW